MTNAYPTQGTTESTADAGAAAAAQRSRTPLERISHTALQGKLSGSGIFLTMVGGTMLATLLGFLLNGATQIPAATGWGLVASSLVAAALVRRRDRHIAIWGPPLATAVVVLVLGQLTLLGSGFSITRELSMFLSAMSSAAPAQLLSMIGAFAITFWRFRPRKKPRPTS